jgi:hypothetical protein
VSARGRQVLLLKFGELWKTKIDDLEELEYLDHGTSKCHITEKCN